MNLENQNKLLKYSLGVIVLLFLILIIVFNHRNLGYKNDINDLKAHNELLRKMNDKSLQEIDEHSKLYALEAHKKDSLSKVISRLSRRISSKDAELALIQSRYKGVDLDSLLKIATERYEKDKHINPIPD